MRLIDEESLWARRPRVLLGYTAEISKEYADGWNDCIAAFQKIVLSEPTAYDVDAVLDEVYCLFDCIKEKIVKGGVE
mgnify:FL=1